MKSVDGVVVVGSGPAGLACAAELGKRGVDVTVLERGDTIAAAWAGRYDALRLNTSRALSALPGAPFPRAFGQFLGRDEYVGYLADYRSRHRVAVRLGAEVTRIDPQPDGTGWRVQCRHDDVATARHVVVATGMLNRPVIPDWPGRSSYVGVLLHSAAYRNAEPFTGKDVLVVGPGCSGLEIAHDLIRGGARRVQIAVRTPPNILLRSIFGMPGDLVAPLMLRMPVSWADRMARVIRRLSLPDLAERGLPIPDEGPLARMHRTGDSPAVTDRPVLDEIRSGAITVVPAVRDLCERGALLADSSTVDADAIIAATGYATGLDGLVEHLGVLDERGMPHEVLGGEAAPGLRFVGYVARPGLTRYAGVLGRRAAQQIATRVNPRRSAPTARA